MFFIAGPSHAYHHNDQGYYDIAEPEIMYVSIKVLGLDKAMRADVLALLRLEDFSYRTDIDPKEIQAVFEESVKIIDVYLRSQGYYDAKITSSLQYDYDTWYAIFDINAGPPIVIDRVSVEVNGPGKYYSDVQDFLADFPIKSKDRFIHSRYESAKNRLQKLVRQNGYVDAKLTLHKIAIHRGQHSADIFLRIETGERYFFGPISIMENNIDPVLIQKFITLQEGDSYSSEKILEQQNALGDSDYYSEIYVKPMRERAVNNIIPIDITTVLRKPSKYSVGLGYSTDIGINGSLAWSRRRLNYKGHRLFLQTTVSKIGAIVGIRYRMPFRNPRHDEYVITTNITYQDTDTSVSKIGQMGFARSILRGNWREILSLEIQRELFSVSDQNDSANLLIPSANWTWQVPRGRLFTREGRMLSIRVRASSEEILSSASFIQNNVDSKWILPMSTRGRLITRASLGLTGVDSVLDLPASFRFFTGGDQSIRGYSFATLGPKNEEGDVIGGKHLIIGSIEYDFRIKGDWSVAAFYDVGNAYNRIKDIDVAQGVGVGIRWNTIVGQVRIDVANAVSEADKPWRIHLSVGPDF
ncbi:MAG: autotransporter assembly complex family protein [Thiohalomonadales bacterium]